MTPDLCKGDAWLVLTILGVGGAFLLGGSGDQLGDLLHSIDRALYALL